MVCSMENKVCGMVNEVKIWKDIEDVLKDMLKNVQKDAPEINSLCGDYKEDSGGIVARNRGKDLCKMLIKIIYWIDGLIEKEEKIGHKKWNWKWERRKDIKEEDWELQAYLRCILGKITMTKMLATHCDMDRVTPIVTGAIEGTLLQKGVQAEHEKCDEIDFRSLNIGKKFFWEEIDKWIKQETREGGGIRKIKSDGEKCVGTAPTKKTSADAVVKKKNVVKLLGSGDPNELQELIEKDTKLPKEVLNKVVEKIQKKLEKKKGAQYKCPKRTITKDGFVDDDEELTIGEWFTAFSNNVSEDDKMNFGEWDTLRAVCDDLYSVQSDMSKYNSFCEIMVRNLLLVTEVGNQYKNEDGKTPCEKKVKNIPLCNLLKVWMEYMRFLCAPEEVMKHVFEAVEPVRAILHPGGNYAKCEYGTYAINYRGQTDMLEKVWKLLHDSVISGRVGIVTKHTWCTDYRTRKDRIRAPTGDGLSRADKGAQSQGINGNAGLKNLEELLEKIRGPMEEERQAELKFLEQTIQTVIQEEQQKQQQQPQGPPPPPPPPPNPGDQGTVSGGEEGERGVFKPSEAPAPVTKKEEPGEPPDKVTTAPKDSVQEQPGKDTSSPKRTPSKEDCKDNTVDAGVDPGACFDDLDNDLPIGPSPPAPSNEHHEATGDTGPKGVAGSSPVPALVVPGQDDLPLPNPPQRKLNLNFKEKSDESYNAFGGGGKDNKQTENSAGSSSRQAPDGPPTTVTATTTSSAGSISTNRTSDPGRGGTGGSPPAPVPLIQKNDHPSDLLTPYLPTIPVFLGISAMSYLLWKYFFLGKKRKRYRRAHQVRGSPTLEEQLLPHVDDQAHGPHEYTLIKKGRQPRSVSMGTKKPKKLVDRRGVGRRTIIDIHLEVLDECQKGDTKLVQEDFFEILVQEFMGCEFIKEKNVPEEQVPSSDSGFRGEDFVSKDDVPKEQVPSSDSVFRV
ncbi:SICA antigen [Plasmodium coatneyi]|uniref:SICA antigen n=1 Tax=Plasmodium coatneyi TaxID=208452 RepID=A0A1B1DVT8_9APIC|nr:SICA antigen [Plasmodium coatneyi]ANQ06892.1 SICA antigen [Plasmodium coatneyi]